MMAWDKLTMFAIYALSSLTLSLLFFAVHYFVDKSIVHKANIWRAELLLVTRIGGFTFLWYSISVTFTMFNKWFLTTWEGGFSFSALYTGGHMCYKFIFSRLWQCQTGTVVEPFSWYLFLVMVFPIGVTTAIDIMFSNLSLQYITITLYTITKTSVIAWTFMWALILKMEVFKLKTFVVVCFICLGISLAVASPTAISFTGVSYCLVASAAGGLRWAFTERLVRSNEQCKSPFVCLHHIAPVSATFMLPVGLVVDGVPFLNSQFAHDNNLAMLSFGILTCGGIMAFALILVEVKLVQLTSSVTMGVLGQLKELLQIIVAIIIFKDQVSSMNAMGLALALLMVGVYKWIKRGENLENFKAQLLSGQESVVELESLLTEIRFELDIANDSQIASVKVNPKTVNRVKNGTAVRSATDNILMRQSSATTERSGSNEGTVPVGSSVSSAAEQVKGISRHLIVTDSN